MYYALAMVLCFIETIQVIFAMMFAGIAITEIILAIKQVDIEIRKKEEIATKSRRHKV